MTNRIILATLLGAMVSFLWGFASWSLLSWHKPKTFQNSSEVARVIQKGHDGHGMYIVPPPADNAQPDVEAIQRGPFMYAIVRPGELHGWSMWKPMVLNFTVNLFLATLIAVIMVKRSHYRSKVLVGMAFGVFAGVSASMPLMIWMELPTAEAMARLLDPIIAWTLAAIVMGWVVKKPKRRIFTS